MKIVGIVNGYKEAEDIEEIVKVFVIEKRVSSLISDKIIENANTHNMILPSHNLKYFKKSDEKTINSKVEDNSITIFNVRGIN